MHFASFQNAFLQVSYVVCLPRNQKHDLVLPAESFSFLSNYPFCFLSYFVMKSKRRLNDLFGGAASFSGSQLPTYGDVGRQWRQSRLEMESANPGVKITNCQVAKQVLAT